MKRRLWRRLSRRLSFKARRRESANDGTAAGARRRFLAERACSSLEAYQVRRSDSAWAPYRARNDYGPKAVSRRLVSCSQHTSSAKRYAARVPRCAARASRQVPLPKPSRRALSQAPSRSSPFHNALGQVFSCNDDVPNDLGCLRPSPVRNRGLQYVARSIPVPVFRRPDIALFSRGVLVG